MQEIERVLYPTDFSDCARETLPHALFLAEKLDAQLHVLHALVLQDYGVDEDALRHLLDPEEVERRLSELAESRLAELLTDRGTRRLEIREAQRRGSAAGPVILEYAEELGVDLIVMGTHGHRGWRRLVLGSVAQEVVRLATCPVLTVRTEDGVELEAIETILVPVDFSTPCRRAVAWAKRMAACYDARIEIVHVAEPRYGPFQYGAAPVATHAPSLRQAISESREALAKFVRETPEFDESWERRVVGGRPASEIIGLAEQGQADMIVIASHGFTGLERILLGSVTEEVVRTSPCPVLTVKPD